MGLRDKIKQNLGVNLPPMISRSGNVFTLRDAAGNERPSVPSLDIIIADGNQHVSKQYREVSNYDPNDPTPPDCFSDNGESPSIMALKPQSDFCINCKWNARNSAVSRVTGKGIKACSDNQKLAVFVADDPQHILYQLVITPGNLSEFRQYIRSLEGHKYEPEEVVTRLTFIPKSTGLMTFEPVAEADEGIRALIKQHAGTQAAMFVTGEDDRPYQPQLAGPRTESPKQIEAHVEPGPSTATGPTREELEARLAEMRTSEKTPPPRKAAPKPAAASAPQPQADIPAFLSKGKPPTGQGSFGLVSSAPPPPAEVTAMLDKVNPMEERVASAFKLPLRS